MLRLSPEDQEEYQRLCDINNQAKGLANLRGDKLAARRARQANTALYEHFKERELPEERSYTKWDREQALSLEARIERIEEHLKLGVFAEDFLGETEMTCIKQDPILYVRLRIDDDLFEEERLGAWCKYEDEGGPEVGFPLNIGDNMSLWEYVERAAYAEGRALGLDVESNSHYEELTITWGTVEQYKEYVAKLTAALAPLAKWVTIQPLKEAA